MRYVATSDGVAEFWVIRLFELPSADERERVWEGITGTWSSCLGTGPLPTPFGARQTEDARRTATIEQLLDRSFSVRITILDDPPRILDVVVWPAGDRRVAYVAHGPEPDDEAMAAVVAAQIARL